MHSSILPKSLQDESNLVLEKCIKKALDINLIPIMTCFADKMSKNVLFLKAQQLSLTDGDGWQNCKTEQEKRELIKNFCVKHKFKATKKCIQEIISDSNTTIQLSEWFTYDGINNHYKLECNGDNLEEIEKLLATIEQNKRLSSKLDSLIYNLTSVIENNLVITHCIGEMITIDFDN